MTARLMDHFQSAFIGRGVCLGWMDGARTSIRYSHCSQSARFQGKEDENSESYMYYNDQRTVILELIIPLSLHPSKYWITS